MDRRNRARVLKTHYEKDGAALCAVDWKIGVSKPRLTADRELVDCGLCKLMLQGKVWRAGDFTPRRKDAKGFRSTDRAATDQR